MAAGQTPDPDRLRLGAADRALAGRLLRRLEGEWHDGDENLVRGLLDSWIAPDHGAAVVAQRLLRGAEELQRIGARPQTWWFFLWEMESLTAALVAG